MLALGVLNRSSRTAPVFGPPHDFTGSTLDEVGRQGLFGVHNPRSNQIALLKNGDESFAVRVQLLEAAKKSIRIQALIFTGDEAGLHITEILKRKKSEGLDVRVIILTNSPATNDLPELTMVGRSYYKIILALNEDARTKNSGGNVQIWEWYGSERAPRDRVAEASTKSRTMQALAADHSPCE